LRDLPPAWEIEGQLASATAKDLEPIVTAALKRKDIAALAMLVVAPKASKMSDQVWVNWPEESRGDAARLEVLSWVVTTGTPETAARLLATATREVGRTPAMLDTCLGLIESSHDVVRQAAVSIINGTPGPDLVKALEGRDLAHLLPHLSTLPLKGRSRIMWGVWKTSPAAIAEATLWGSWITLEEIEVLARTTPDCQLLDDPWVAECVVSPRVEGWINKVDHRSALARMLTWPAPLLDHVTSDSAVSAIRRSTRNDPWLRDMVEVLAQDVRVQTLTKDLSTAQSALAAAQEALSAALDAEAESRAAAEIATARAAAAARDQISAGAHEIRQETLRLMRVLASILAQAGRLDAATPVPGVLDVLLQQAGHEGLISIGPVGAVVAYDQERHEFLGADLPDTVEITELGFVYEDPQGPVVLRRAAAVRPRS